MKVPLLLALLALTLAAGEARAARGLLFYASFDRWLPADVGRGGRTPVKRVGGKLAPGRFGQALALDGASYLEFPAGANVGADACTLALWVRPEKWGIKTYDSILGLSDDERNCLHLERSHPGGLLRLVIGGPETPAKARTRSLFSKEPLPEGKWTHVAVAWDTTRGFAEMFLDGKSAGRLEGRGPLPKDPPCILVGCGFGRLARALTGLIDDVAILDHAATEEEVQALMQGVQKEQGITEVANATLRALVEREAGAFTVGDAGEAGGRLLIGPAQPYARAAGKEITWPRFEREEEAPPLAPRMGPAAHRAFSAKDPESGLELRFHVQAQEKQPLVLLWSEVRNTSAEPLTVTDLGVLRTPDAGGLTLAAPAGGLRAFIDSGGLTGSGSRDFAAKNADHAAHGALVVADTETPWACSFAFLSFRTALVTNRIRTDAAGQARAAEAACAYPGGYRVAPGETLASEILGIALHPSGLDALERWADTVVAINEIPPPRHCPSGWNSWYAYRLTVTEDLLLQNARIVRERFAPLDATNIQIDHGWQYKDVVGNWVPNDRFPHGLNWLSDRLREMGLTLGLWTAVTQVSEHAPLYAEHPEALFTDGKGAPFVADPRWFWVPHGKTFTLDPTHPLGEAQYRKVGEMLRGYGCVYTKNDFQGNLLQTSAVPHDPALTRGVPIYRKAMAAFKEGMGPQMAYHACNAPLNVAAGLCDVAWVHRDLGNPAGNWAHLRAFANDFACRTHVSGKFYWSDPDYLQVGQGSLDETRVRMVMMALGGGPAFICDRLPELPEERLALIPKCLPSYRKTARPLDLFTHEGYPRVWDLPVETAWGSWHVVGLLNLDEQPARIELNLAELGLAQSRRVRPPRTPPTVGGGGGAERLSSALVYDFFEERLLGEVSAGGPGLEVLLRVPVPAASTRLLRIVPKEAHPFVLSTDMHLTQGGVELPEVQWDAKGLILRGTARRAPGMSGRVLVYVPEGFVPAAKAALKGRVLEVPVTFKTRDAKWSVAFRRV